MIDVLDRLKKYNLSITNFARKLDISRNTLYTYIDQFQEKVPIKNERYSLIMNKLFPDDELSLTKFRSILDGYSDLIKRENVIGVSKFDTKKSDLLFLIINEIKTDFESTDYNEDMYVFIRMLIYGYKSEKKFIDLIDYFLVLNSKKDLNSLEPDQQKRLSVYYKYFRLIESEEVYKNYNDDYLKDFTSRIQHLKEKSNEEEKKIKDKLSELIKAEIERKLSLGTKADDISIEDIINSIKTD